MKKATVDIIFLNGKQVQGDVRFHPGEQLQGRLTITPYRDSQCREVRVTLRWFTQGRGTRVEGKVLEHTFPLGALNQGVPITRDFSFTLPEAPWSHRGKYLHVVWAVEVQVDLPRARDLTARATFILHPYGLSETDA